MSSHTTWYPADEPESTQPPASHHQPVSISSMSFRLIAFPDGAPYPLDHLQQTPQPLHMVDLVSGERFHRANSIRQPVAEDFLRPDCPLPAPPAEEYDSDQNLPVIEPDSYWNNVHADDYHLSWPEHSDNVNVSRRDTITTTKPLNVIKAGPAHKRSKSAINLPSQASHKSGTTAGLDIPVPTPVPAPDISDDMFSPVMGGLHRIDTAPVRKPSKMCRLKRFFSLKHRRQYGRASR
jgi:hypothetical protein